MSKGNINIFDDHEKSQTWTKVWYLTQRDSANKPLYYKGLTKGEREEWLDYLHDLLELERKAVIGERFGDADISEDARPKPISAGSPFKPDGPMPIHDPSLYKFGSNDKWIDWALDAQSGAKRGRYRNGYPSGLVVHWTAGHRNGLKAGNELMRNTGMLYLLMDAEGRVAQSDSLQSHGYHAGKSSHSGAVGYVSDEYAGIELQAAGVLSKKGSRYVSWFGTSIPAKEVVTSSRRDNIASGHYHSYTREQMLSLRKTVVWLYLNNPNVFSIDRVVGHDEVSPGRKVDPGASLVTGGIADPENILTMSEFRQRCWNDVDIVTELRKAAA